MLVRQNWLGGVFGRACSRGRLALILLLLFAAWLPNQPALAYDFMASGANAVVDPLLTGATETKHYLQKLLLAVAGIALLALAALAMFGSISWKGFFSLCAGLLTVVLLADVTKFLGVDTNNTVTTPFTDVQIFTKSCTGVYTSSSNIRVIVFAIGAIAAVALGVAAMFGSLSWKGFFSLIAGMGLIALIDQLLLYFNYTNNASCDFNTAPPFTNTQVFNTVGNAAGDNYAAIRTMAYAVGGMGITSLGIMSMFGKLRFSVLFMAIGGLAIIGLIDQAVLYAAGQGVYNYIH
jgi:type IV secretory pathway VirB2 component (pilin)